MDIIRNFNGMKLVITLTESEMKTAFNEQERRYDHAEIRDVLWQFEEEGAPFYPYYLAEMSKNTEFLDDVAHEFHTNHDVCRPDREQLEEIVEAILERCWVSWARSKGIMK